MDHNIDRSGLALSVANHIPAMLAYWDKEQICRFANKAYLEWFGKTTEEMIDKISLEQLLGPLYKKNFLFIQGALKGKAQYFERDITIPSGEIRHSMATYMPNIVNDKVEGFFVHVVDVTPLKTLETELKKSELKFKGLLESAPDAIVITNQMGEIVLVNRQTEKMFGYSKDELINKQVEILIPTDVQNKHVKHRTDYFKDPKVRAMGYGIELIAIRKDGVQFPVEVSLSPLETSDGILMSAAIRDITARKLTEDKLKESEKLYRLISTNSKDLISLYKAEEEPIRIFISPSCKEIMGYEQEEMINRSSFDFIVPEDAEQMRKITHPTTLDGKVATCEYRARKKDGSIIWLETITNPFYDEDGKVVGFQTSARDITQHKLFEKELTRAKEQAEIASSKSIELLNEKNDLIGLLTHDMRAPINQMIGLSRIMALSIGNEDMLKQCLAKFDLALKTQLTLLNNVLQMLKSDQLNTDNNAKETVGLLGIVKKVCDELEFDSQAKNLTILVDVPETIQLDVQKEIFMQAMQNLISNAIKFSMPGRTIWINATKNSHTTIVIKDEGIGFVQDKAERLFDRFTKEGRPGTNKEASTGLGLYLVKKIIENHGGTISANSKGKGTGATFTIQLPTTVS